MRYPFWLRDIQPGVTDSMLESEALLSETHDVLCDRDGPWHWRSGWAGGTVGSGSGTRARVKEWGSSSKNLGTSVESGDAGSGTHNSSGTTEVSGGRAVAFDGETVDSGNATGILDG